MNLFYCCLFMSFLCTCQEKDTTPTKSIIQIAYTATTRGSSYSCSIHPNEIKITGKGVHSFKKTGAINTRQWQKLLTAVKGITLEKINNLETTTSKSATDAARITTIEIHTENQVYESVHFDEGSPPEVLKPLVNQILSLAKTVE